MVNAEIDAVGQNAKSTSTLKKLAVVAGWSLLLVITFNHVLSGIYDLPFTPDSWTYWELSKTILSGDFYHISGWRNFQSLQPYSTSFPPLWPLLIALANDTLNSGPVVMPILAGLLVLASMLVIEFTFRSFYFYRGVGAIAGCGLFIHKPFVEQIETASSVPLAVFILSILLLVWVTRQGIVRNLLLGICAGLLCLARFDALPFAVVLGVFLLTEEYWMHLAGGSHSASRVKIPPVFSVSSLAAVMIYYTTLLVTLSPYIMYSVVKFGKIWVTDNSLVALAVTDVYVTDYYINWPATLANEPVAWFNKVAHNAFHIFIKKKWIITILPALLVLFILWKKPSPVVCLDNQQETLPVCGFRQHLLLISVIAIAYSATFIGYAVTGYSDNRYFSPHIMLFSVGLALAVCFLLAGHKVWRFQITMIFILVLGAAGVNAKSLLPDMGKIADGVVNTEESLAAAYDKLVECYRILPDGKKILVLGDNNEAARIAALTGIETLMMPRNYPQLDEHSRNHFMASYNVGAIYVYPTNHKQVYKLTRCENLPAFYYLEAE